MDRSKVAIVIPALNEFLTIKAIVDASSNYGIPIVVDDGSDDGTAEVAALSGAIVVSHNINYGYDYALNSGFKKASEIGCEIIITLDADGQHDPRLIHEFINEIYLGADIIIGVRSKFQRFAEVVFSWYTRWIYKIHDPLCGMKAYRVEIYRALGHFDSFGSVGTEMMIFAARRGYKLVEKPIEVLDRKGEARFGKKIAANCKIFRAMFFSIAKSI
jgi:glycosyltransferase involved in cell wall biosynthesis